MITKQLEEETLPPKIEWHHEKGEDYTLGVTPGVLETMKHVVVIGLIQTQALTLFYPGRLAIAKVLPHPKFDHWEKFKTCASECHCYKK